MIVATKKPPLVCCKPFMNLTEAQRKRWEWQVLHQLCHNKIPFSVERVADIARVDLGTARAMVGEARHLKWLRDASLGDAAGTRLLRGLLQSRRS